MADMAVPLDQRCIRLDDFEVVLAVCWGSHCDVGSLVVAREDGRRAGCETCKYL